MSPSLLPDRSAEVLERALVGSTRVIALMLEARHGVLAAAGQDDNCK